MPHRIALTAAAHRRLLAAGAALLVLSTGVSCANDHVSEDNSASAPETAATAPALQEVDAELAQRLDGAIEQAMTAMQIPGAIVGAWGPDGAYVRAFGVADKATGAPMETDFFSRIGSVTKTFTVTAVLQLVDADELGLDDPVSRYVDNVPDGDRITLRQLAGMRSGLPNYTESEEFSRILAADPQRSFAPRELLDLAFAQPPAFAPGEDFQYSNTNTVLLGLVVEKVGGQPLPEFFQDRILVPLQMDRTSFPTTDALPAPHAQGYTRLPDGDAEMVATEWNPSWAWAAGAMISTLDDLRVWAPALASGQLLTPATQAQRMMLTGLPGLPGLPVDDGYGLGIFNLGGWVGHNGSLPGYQTVAVHLAQRETTLVILTNTDIEQQSSVPATTLATAITKELTPDHIYALNPQIQNPQTPALPTPPR